MDILFMQGVRNAHLHGDSNNGTGRDTAGSGQQATAATGT
jgi:hypothetical protein